MNKNKVVALAVAAFLLGDAQAIIRARIHHRKQINKLKMENELLQLKVNAFSEFVLDAFETNDPNGAAERFVAKAEFINILDESL